MSKANPFIRCKNVSTRSFKQKRNSMYMYCCKKYYDLFCERKNANCALSTPWIFKRSRSPLKGTTSENIPTLLPLLCWSRLHITQWSVYWKIHFCTSYYPIKDFPTINMLLSNTLWCVCVCGVCVWSLSLSPGVRLFLIGVSLSLSLSPSLVCACLSFPAVNFSYPTGLVITVVLL